MSELFTGEAGGRFNEKVLLEKTFSLGGIKVVVRALPPGVAMAILPHDLRLGHVIEIVNVGDEEEGNQGC